MADYFVSGRRAVAQYRSVLPTLHDGEATPFAVDSSGRLLVSGASSGIPSLGQKVMSQSLPIVFASDQTNIPVEIANSRGSSVTLFDTQAFSNKVSNPVDCSKYRSVSVSVSFTQDQYESGTFFLQGSNDTNNPSTWAFISGSGQSYTSSGGQINGFTTPPISLCYRFMRGVWVQNFTSTQSISVLPDVNGSLAGDYFRLHGSQSSTYPFGDSPNKDGISLIPYFVVSGLGTPPLSSIINTLPPVPIRIETNDSATTIASKLASQLPNVAVGGFVSDDGDVSTEFVLPEASSVVGNRHIAALGHLGVILIKGGSNEGWLSQNYGRSWMHYTGSFPNRVNELKMYLNKFVAVGDGGDIHVSTNGLEWTKKTSGTTNNILCLDCDSTHQVWVALTSTQVLFSTDNAETWSILGLGTTNSWSGITYNGAIWVAVSPTSNIYCTNSSNVGILGSWLTGSSINRNYHTVISNKSTSLILAMASGGIYETSTNGNTWISRSLPLTNTSIPGSIVWDVLNNNFVYVVDGATAYSSDGVTWGVVLQKKFGSVKIASGSDNLWLCLNQHQKLFNCTSSEDVCVISAGSTGILPIEDGNTSFVFRKLAPGPFCYMNAVAFFS